MCGIFKKTKSNQTEIFDKDFSSFSGIWLTSDKNFKLVIRDNIVSTYRFNGNDYIPVSTGTVKFDSDGSLISTKKNGAIGYYSSIIKKGSCLHAVFCDATAHKSDSIFLPDAE